MRITLNDLKKYDIVMIDVGNVIIHDLPFEVAFSYYVFDYLKKFSHITENEFYTFRNEQLSRGNVGWINDFCREKCGNEWEKVVSVAWEKVLKIWGDISIPIEGSISIIHKLSANANLIIVANQPFEMLNVLKKNNIYSCFKNIYFDSMINISKPDIKFYEHIIQMNKSISEKVLMIGDRIDNDIYPSSILGIDTAWIKYIPKHVKTPLIPSLWQQKYYENYCKIGIYNMVHTNIEMQNLKIKFIADSIMDLFELEL